jgi:hypothetical protein
MEKIKREHGDLFRNPTALPDFGVVVHYAAWSRSAIACPILIEWMVDYPDIPLYIIDITSPAYDRFFQSSGFRSGGDSEMLFVVGGEIMYLLWVGFPSMKTKQSCIAALDRLRNSHQPELLLVQRITRLTLEFIGGSPWPMGVYPQPDQPLTHTGQRAMELMAAYETRFQVDLTDFRFDDYFHPEGFEEIKPSGSLLKRIFTLPKPQPPAKKVLTIGHLVQGVKAGRLDEAVIWGE